MKFKYMIEELLQYSFEVEANSRDEADDVLNKLTDEHFADFNAILSDDRTLNGQELDGYVDIQCYEPSEYIDQ